MLELLLVVAATVLAVPLLLLMCGSDKKGRGDPGDAPGSATGSKRESFAVPVFRAIDSIAEVSESPASVRRSEGDSSFLRLPGSMSFGDEDDIAVSIKSMPQVTVIDISDTASDLAASTLNDAPVVKRAKQKKKKTKTNSKADSYTIATPSPPPTEVDEEGFSVLPEDRTRVSKFFDDSSDSDSSSDSDDGRGVQKWASLRINEQSTIQQATEAELSTEISALSNALGSAPESRSRARTLTNSMVADVEDAWTVVEERLTPAPSWSSRPSSVAGPSQSSAPSVADDPDDPFASLAAVRQTSLPDDVTLCELELPDGAPDALELKALKTFLRQASVRLWLNPYSDELGQGHIPDDLVAKCARALSTEHTRARGVLDYMRVLTFNRKLHKLHQAGQAAVAVR
eukprot:m.36958 g.36958  ORF g.36958 m.36958 type:complete len:400 (+) comp11065_c0_seq2:563-1762(+)